MAYPALVAETLPAPFLGLFIAVLLGAVFSTYNSLLNSAATMFALDIYKPLINKNADDHRLIYVSKIFAIVCAIVTMITAPNLVNAPDGLYIFIAKFAGFIAIPVVSLVVLGLFARKLRIPPRAAQFVILFHIVIYYVLVWGLEKMDIVIPMHWMHVFTILFFVEAGILIVWSWIKPHSESYEFQHAPKVQMLPWRFSMLISAILLSCATLTYVIFSNIGIAYAEGVVAPSFWLYFILATLGCIAFCYWAHTCFQIKYECYINNRYGQSSPSGEE